MSIFPAAPVTVGAYLASLADSHAPSTIRRRLAALGKMPRFNDLPWNSAHRDIQGPLQGVLRTRGRPVQTAAALTLASCWRPAMRVPEVLMPGQPWGDIRGMGNWLRHAYDRVDLGIVWNTAQDRLPALVVDALRALTQLQTDQPEKPGNEASL
jgi:hypothetical protein